MDGLSGFLFKNSKSTYNIKIILHDNPLFPSLKLAYTALNL